MYLDDLEERQQVTGCRCAVIPGGQVPAARTLATPITPGQARQAHAGCRGDAFTSRLREACPEVRRGRSPRPTQSPKPLLPPPRPTTVSSPPDSPVDLLKSCLSSRGQRMPSLPCKRPTRFPSPLSPPLPGAWPPACPAALVPVGRLGVPRAPWCFSVAGENRGSEAGLDRGHHDLIPPPVSEAI